MHDVDFAGRQGLRGGAPLTAAEKVAADTERRPRVKDPEYADVSYSAVFLTTGAVQDGIDRLRGPIPCYGLSDAGEPPPPLRAEAESMWAEGADIFESEWGSSSAASTLERPEGAPRSGAGLMAADAVP
ncbi:hypothetical protein ACFY5C_09820 [Streptomyces sp. NPDC012935]|uniref:hypothetical protein n=1 Tax=Streptomyces sp. NPDC012935 TaxID=3364857 RepID=UPI0036B21214